MSMEASGLIFSQPPCFSSSNSCRESKYRGISGVLPGFYDNGCFQYYHNRGGKSSREVSSMGVIRCEKAVKENRGPMKMKKKKQMKLLKGLSRDLYAFSQMGFGLDSNLDQDLLNQVKGNTITEAADLLLEQLQKLRAEKNLEKKRRQEQKKLGKSSGQMRNSLNLVEVSSSCSESSSDSECGEVMDLKDLKLAQPKQEENAMNRDGPNVRVLSGEAGDSRGVSSNNPLFIGVGLEDVDMILSNFLGENRDQPGFAAAT